MGQYYACNTGLLPAPKHVQISSIGVGRLLWCQFHSPFEIVPQVSDLIPCVFHNLQRHSETQR